jgi:hypothetical protein
MRITFAVKDFFFDRAVVIAALEKARYKALYKAGAFVRRRARSSMRRRKRASAPGTPPSAHATEGHSIKTILYAYQGESDSTIVGPVQLNQVNYTMAGNRTSIPRLHEFGGDLAIREWKFEALDQRTFDIVQQYPSAFNWSQEWNRRDLRWKMAARKRKWTLVNFGVKTRIRNAKYPARPFMRPALEAEAPKFVELFRDSIMATSN